MPKLLLSLVVFCSILVSGSAQGALLIRKGEMYRWTTNSGQGGSMRVSAVDGNLFEVEQTNDGNRSAGIVRMYGAVVDNGRKVVILNIGQWREVWEGELHHNEIVGTLFVGSSGIRFRISPDSMHSPHRDGAMRFFKKGRVLRWETSAVGGQAGTFVVIDSDGPRFTLEQTNRKNPGAGVVRFEGEVREGRIYIYNRKWKETWVGVFKHGSIVGQVNERTDFRISE